MSIDRILSELLASPARAGLAGAVAGGLLTSKAGRKLGKRAAELGGLAAIAGLAYTAWRRYEARGGAPEGGRSGFDAVREPAVLETAGFLPPPRQEAAGEPLARLLLRAMIAAARADGRLDGEERRRLFDRIAGLDLGDAERADLYAELEKPVTPDQLAGAVVGPAQAVEVYAASLLAIEVDTPAERAYLSLLAGRLGLADELVASLHREAGVPIGPR
ncbi:MAG TPA: tellurite resistance TerB family protein [Myxococcota bacterium]|jgi:uncharacterized membrane protein YebE (DUF533 family)